MSRRIQAAEGYYIRAVHVSPSQPHTLNFQRAVIQENLTAGGDVTKIVDVTETLVLSADTVLEVQFGTLSPTITAFTTPSSSVYLSGDSIRLDADVIGRLPLTLQWRRDGVPIPQQTSKSLILSGLTPAHSGTYTFHAENGFGAATSAEFPLTVRDLLIRANGTTVTQSSILAVTPVTVRFISAFPGGQIFYTLDGTEPNFSSTRYTGSFSVSATTHVRSIAYSADFTKTALASLQIIFTEPAVISVLPSGGGSVAVSPSSTVPKGSTVTLTANPQPGWSFMYWDGSVSGSDRMKTLTVDNNLVVRAIFGTTVDTTVAGQGTVTKAPAVTLFPYGSTVRLVGAPNAGNYLALWGNAATGNDNPLAFTVTQPNQTVSALFAALPEGHVTLTAQVSGLGDIAIEPRANSYTRGTLVTLQATPQEGQRFLGWTGTVASTDAIVTVRLNESASVTAVFSEEPRLTIAPHPFGFEITATARVGKVNDLEKSSDLSTWNLHSLVPAGINSILISQPETAFQFFRLHEQ